MELHDGAAFEVAVFGVVADGADVFLDSVIGEAEHHGCGEEGFFVAFAGGALAEDGVVVAGAVDVVVGCQEQGGEVGSLGDEELAGLGGAGGHVFGEVGEAGDHVEDGVFGCDPVVWPRYEACGGKRLGGEHLVGVAQRHAVAVEEYGGFKRGEQHGEDFKLVMAYFEGRFAVEEGLKDEAFGAEGGEHMFADVRFVFCA